MQTSRGFINTRNAHTLPARYSLARARMFVCLHYGPSANNSNDNVCDRYMLIVEAFSYAKYATTCVRAEARHEGSVRYQCDAIGLLLPLHAAIVRRFSAWPLIINECVHCMCVDI